MINRAELKNRAKAVLSNGNYWISLAVCALISIIYQITSWIFNFTLNAEKFAALSVWIVIPLVALIIINMGISIFLYAPLNAGKNRFFIKSAQNDTNISNIFDVFKSDNYTNVVKTIFMRDIRLIGWGMLYIIPLAMSVAIAYFYEEALYFSFLLVFLYIPYIMKYYSYYMVDYIIAENPDTNWKIALNQSREMMRGHRFEVFKLEVSFIGWYLLGILCCGIGVMFVEPYESATMAQLYLDRKDVICSVEAEI